MPQNPYFPPHIGPAPPPKVKPSFIGPTPPPRIGPDPTASGPLGDETAIDRASLDALKRLIPSIPPSWGAGEGGSALSSPYDLSSARNAAGVMSQAGGDINLPHETIPPPAVTSDPGMNQRADDINAKANSDYFNDMLNYRKPQAAPSPAIQGLQGAVAPKPRPVTNPSSFAANSTANAPIQLAQLRQNALSEQEDRLFNAERAQGGQRGSPTSGPFRDYATNVEGMPGAIPPQKLDNTSEIGALKGLIDRSKAEIAEDPFTGEAAQGQTAGIEKAGLQANLGGFRTPQEAAEAARQAETYKIEAPERAARIAGQADIEKQKIASGGLLDIAKEQGQGATNFLEMMRQMQAAGGDIRGITLPKGGGSLSFAPERQIAPAILRDVTVARQNFAKALESPGLLNGNKTIAQGQLDAAINTALSQYNFTDPQDRQEVLAALMDPANKGKSIDQVFDRSQMSPEDFSQISSFIALIGGF